MKIKDLIKELEKLDGEKTIGTFNSNEDKITVELTRVDLMSKEEVINVYDGYEVIEYHNCDYYM